jgi:hypothetical protein
MSKKSTFIGPGVIFAVVVSAVVLYAWMHPLRARRSICRRNLQIIQECKREWMYGHHKTLNDIPSWEDLRPYLQADAQDGWSNGIPVCPQGGNYILGRVGEPARCSIGGPEHSL